MVYGGEGDLMTGRTWVVVADSSQASIYLREQRNSPLRTVTTIQDFPSRPEEQPPADGKDAQPAANGNLPLARQVCGTLERGRSRGAFEELILIAPPRVLGMMRDSLTKPTLGRVRREIPKNLVRCQPERIRHYLRD